MVIIIVLFWGVGLLLAFVGMLDPHVVTPAPLIIIGLLLIVGGLTAFRELLKFCVSIDENSLTVTHVFSSRSVLLDEIEGFRKGEKNSIVLDVKSGGRSITVSGSIGRREEFLEWLEKRYPDIDAARVQEVTQEVLSDEKFGDSEDERAMLLGRARKIMRYSTLVSLLFVWAVISPEPIQPLMLVLLAIPPIAVWLIWKFKGIIRLYSSKAKPYPTFLMTVIFAEGAAFLALTKKFDVYLFEQRFWLLLAAATVIVSFVWIRACRAAIGEEKNRVVVFAGILVVAGLYCYNLLLFSNFVYDRGEAAVWPVQVERKHVSSGKTRTYWLYLTSWGRFEDGNGVQVSRQFYYDLADGDTVDVHLHPGKWGAAWYQVMGHSK